MLIEELELIGCVLRDDDSGHFGDYKAAWEELELKLQPYLSGQIKLLELTEEEVEYLLAGVEADTEAYRAEMTEQLAEKLKEALKEGEE